MNDFDIHTLAAAYALDALDNQEIELFEAHLPSCEQCESEVASFRETAAVLANAESTNPPESLRSSVLASISTTRQLPPLVSPPTNSLDEQDQPATSKDAERLAAPIDLTERRNRRRAMQIAFGAVAAAIVLVVGIVVLGDRDPQLPDEVAGVVDADDANEIVLSKTADDLGDLKIVYSADEAGLALIGEGLSVLDDDKTYELWAIDDDGARAVGLFDATDSGDVAAFFSTDESVDVTWGITIEPAGGSAQPTTEPLFLSA